MAVLVLLVLTAAGRMPVVVVVLVDLVLLKMARVPRKSEIELLAAPDAEAPDDACAAARAAEGADEDESTWPWCWRSEEPAEEVEGSDEDGDGTVLAQMPSSLRFGAALAGRRQGPATFCVAMRGLITFALAVLIPACFSLLAWYRAASGWTETEAAATSLETVSQSMFAVVLAASVPPVLSLWSVTGDDRDGELAALGAGATRITASAAKSLRNWDSFGWVVNAFCLWIVFVNLSGDDDKTTLQFWLNLIFAAATCPVIFASMVSLKFAATLVSESVLDACKQITDTDEDAAEWDADVVPAHLGLLQVTLPTLSRGWATGLVVFFWAFALMSFVLLLTAAPEVRWLLPSSLESYSRCRSSSPSRWQAPPRSATTCRRSSRTSAPPT